jgi:predicted dehydrogenase
VAASDIVDVCTPPTEHAGPTIEAAQAGRHVVCEKPIARTLADAERMVAACAAANVQLFVAHVVRFFPEFARAKAVSDSGALGRLGVVRTVRGGARPQMSPWFADVRQSGGVILDVGIHDIDYLRWLCGDVERVFARGLTWHNLAADHALITLRFASGAIGHIESSWAFPQGTFRTFIELAGTEGVLVHDSDDVQPLDVRYHHGQEPAVGARPNAPAVSGDDPYLQELQHFLNVLGGAGALLVTPRDAVEALRVALAALASMRSGRPVSVADFQEEL